MHFSYIIITFYVNILPSKTLGFRYSIVCVSSNDFSHRTCYSLSSCVLLQCQNRIGILALYFRRIAEKRLFNDLGRYILPTDHNECADNSHMCHVNAACSNTEGSYRCECELGFIGNGRNCEGQSRDMHSNLVFICYQ